jgi:SET domain-containing protein
VSFCNCTDGCQNPKKCPCYKYNRKLLNPTYQKDICPKTSRMITTQPRATNSINRVFRFCECHPLCGCNKNMCLNYLMAASNKKQFKMQIRRVKKGPAVMWGLFAMEEIPQGAYIMEYRGEVVTKKQGDMRGSYYDHTGLSYLFDMNDPLEEETREAFVQTGYHDEFFPLCLDSMFYGNESRFINHSCDPNC